MNKKYDAKFKEVPFYEIHPEYIPFVGNEYDTYRILLIGESHYIEQKNDENPKYDLDYFREHGGMVRTMNWKKNIAIVITQKLWSKTIWTASANQVT